MPTTTILPAERQISKQSELVYLDILQDPKQPIFTAEALKAIKQLQIKPESLHPKSLGQFMQQYECDEDLAKLNYRYYKQRRTKNLFRIFVHLNQDEITKPQLRSVSPLSEVRRFEPDRVAVEAQRARWVERLVRNRSSKELKLPSLLGNVLLKRTENAKKFNLRQQQIT